MLGGGPLLPGYLLVLAMESTEVSDMLKGSDKGRIIGVIPSFPLGTTLTPLQIIMEPGEVLIFRAMPFLEGSVLGLPILPLWDGLSFTFLGGVLNLVF